MVRYVALVVVAVLIMTMGTTWGVCEKITPKAGVQSDAPLRLTFYYPWFPGHWQEGTQYHPTLGNYDSSDPIVIRKHIDAMQYAKIDAAIVSWWGWGTKGRYGTDAALREILKESRGSGFRWAVYYEWEGLVDNKPSNPSTDVIVSDLDYLYANFANDPSYLHIDGRWVLFVYSDESDGCGTVSRWTEAKTTHPEVYIVLRVFPGKGGCAPQPDAWHQYSAISGSDSQLPFSYTIQPGFWSAVEDHPRLERDLSSWKENIRNMISSGATFQLVSTFNEWREGTPVESATEWATPSGYGAYLDALHSNGDINEKEPTTPVSPPPPTVPFIGVPEILLAVLLGLFVVARKRRRKRSLSMMAALSNCGLA
jgi:hypothetical protein